MIDKRRKNLIISPYAPKECQETLCKMGYSLVYSGVLHNADRAVASHPDMQIVKISQNEWLCAPEVFCHYKPYFDILGLVLYKGRTEPKSPYPMDVSYNVCRAGEYAIHNFKYTDEVFLKNFFGKAININQGYSKCSIAVVSEKAVITSDCGIEKILSAHGFKVLKIKEGHIELSPYKYGFIGGACGLVENDKLLFCGNVKKHPDGERIVRFCSENGVEAISLFDGDLVDIGTIIPLG